MSNPDAIKTFLSERVAPRFSDTLRDVEGRLAALQQEVEDLRAARGSIEWTVAGVGAWYLNIADGVMSVADRPEAEPFMTASQSANDWQRFASGTVGAGFMTGTTRRGLGRSRIERLRAIRGTLRFVLTGLPDGEWSVTTSFGPPPHAGEPQSTIRVAADLAEKLQRGEINPQLVFMQGQIRLEGDAGLAMQVGMALML